MQNNTKELCISLTESFLPLVTSYTTTVQYQMQETDTATNNRLQFVFIGFNALMHYMYNFSILSLYEIFCHQQNGKQMHATKKILHNDPNAIISLKSHWSYFMIFFTITLQCPIRDNQYALHLLSKHWCWATLIFCNNMVAILDIFPFYRTLESLCQYPKSSWLESQFGMQWIYKLTWEKITLTVLSSYPQI